MSSRVANKTWFLHIDALVLHLISAKSEQTAQADLHGLWFARVRMQSRPRAERIAWSIINLALRSWIARGICLLDSATWPALCSVPDGRSAQISSGRDP